ncbi:MAG: 30S ribosomal protein S16 [Saprospiraceae bacterium]|nr:30S ribosomal protein S16 [Bacteroidia bacterium]NNL93247.1 30S ribosomal protein S16 [Saprospiraceae bacterium]
MPVKIRLARRGRKKRPFYHIVIADARAPRDGKFIENIGSYNPMTVPATIELDRDKAFTWINKGAQPTDTVRALLKFKGVYYRKHLMRGVAKGALTEEKAMEMYNEWIELKEAKIADRVEQTKKEREEFWKMVSGEIKPKKKIVDKEAGDAFREGGEEATGEDAPATEETPAEAEAPAAEETPTEAEAPAAEETPAVAEEAAAKEEVKEDAAPAKEEAAADSDDLTKIEGIGPAIAKALNSNGIGSFADLAGKTPEDVKAILEAAEGNFGGHEPTTWPKQAEMAAKGDWDALKKWQDELDGGKEVS